MPLRPNRQRSSASATTAVSTPTHVKKVSAPTPKVEAKEEPVPPMGPAPAYNALYIAHARSLDANLRAGGRYPYTPNSKFRKGLSNPNFLEEQLEKALGNS
jgi:hypothetical protein